MRKAPDVLVRIDDGEPFVRNDDGTYSLRFMILNFPRSLRMTYTYDHLMKTRAFREMTFDERTTGVIAAPTVPQHSGSPHGDYDE